MTQRARTVGEGPVELISCRAQLGDGECYHGSPTARQFGEDGVPQRQDGTFETNTFGGETIVCDACYLRIMPFTRSGAAQHHEIAEAIHTYRGSLAKVRSVDDAELASMRADAARWRDASSAGSPRHASANASVALADREIEARRTS